MQSHVGMIWRESSLSVACSPMRRGRGTGLARGSVRGKRRKEPPDLILLILFIVQCRQLRGDFDTHMQMQASKIGVLISQPRNRPNKMVELRTRDEVSSMRLLQLHVHHNTPLLEDPTVPKLFPAFRRVAEHV